MISPYSSTKYKGFFYPKVALSVLPLFCMLSLNPFANVANAMDKGLHIKGSH